jgi:hypothetical protein
VEKCGVNVCSGKTMQTSKVIILGDSHMKGNVLRIGNYSSAKCEVGGFTKTWCWLGKKLWEIQ